MRVPCVEQDSGGSEMSTTLAKVDEMIAAGLIRPFIFPDPGKPDGIRTFRKPIMTLKDVNFKYPSTDKYIVEKCSATYALRSANARPGHAPCARALSAVCSSRALPTGSRSARAR